MIKQMFITILLAGIMVSCSTTGRKMAQKMRAEALDKNYKGALKIASDKEFYPEKNSKLLRLLEKGIIHHFEGNYCTSAKILSEAKDLSDKLYTVSIGKKLKTIITNDTFDNYYGERYERSLIRFYFALNNYLIYSGGTCNTEKPKAKKLSKKERQNYLARARASILEWDTLLDKYKAKDLGNSTYKDDLSAKLFGAFIHEEIGSSSDRQIAMQLYKDAEKVLFRNYSSYPVFNKKSKEFRSNFKKFKALGEKKVKKKYFTPTSYYKRTNNFIKARQQELKKNRRGNLVVIIQRNLISEKVVKQIEFPLPLSGALYDPDGGGVTQKEFVEKFMKIAFGSKPTFGFEMPEVKLKKTTKNFKIVIKNGKGKIVKRVLTAIINPLSDMAYESMDEKRTSTYAKIGARIAIKHTVAIATAYAGYKIASDSGGIFAIGAFPAAVLSYAGASKAIEASEKADLRCWSLLPHDIRMTITNLPNGTYTTYLEEIGTADGELIKLGKIKIKGKKRHFFNYKI